MDWSERPQRSSAVPFGTTDPRNAVYVASVSCARCGEVNRLVPASTMFLCVWCLRGEVSPTASATRQPDPASRRRRVSVRRTKQNRAA